jgi:geranylgeranyl diphosphate synthase, type I
MAGSHASKIEEMQNQISIQVENITDSLLNGYPSDYQQMIRYQLGIDFVDNKSSNRGKRLRPLFVLLISDLWGADWRNALPAAVAVELLHNFSLVHDDIQDGSKTRRGRESVWKKWGIPQAINTGDALLNLAYLSVFKLQAKVVDSKINVVLSTLQKSCLELTRGQYLDMSFERISSIPMNLYLEMIDGKTASLLSTCFRIGAIIGGASRGDEEIVARAGRELGLAFQIQDDYLGIWGNEKQTGKSIYSDLMTRKKTYPVILGGEKNRDIVSFWNEVRTINVEEAQKIANLLEKEGIKEEVIADFTKKYSETSDIIRNLSIDKQRSSTIFDVIRTLENRTR